MDNFIVVLAKENIEAGNKILINLDTKEAAVISDAVASVIETKIPVLIQEPAKQRKGRRNRALGSRMADRILITLAKKPGTKLTCAKIAEKIGEENGSTSANLTRLYQAGKVEKIGTNKPHSFRITDAGVKVLMEQAEEYQKPKLVSNNG